MSAPPLRSCSPAGALRHRGGKPGSPRAGVLSAGGAAGLVNAAAACAVYAICDRAGRIGLQMQRDEGACRPYIVCMAVLVWAPYVCLFLIVASLEVAGVRLLPGRPASLRSRGALAKAAPLHVSDYREAEHIDTPD